MTEKILVEIQAQRQAWKGKYDWLKMVNAFKLLFTSAPP